MGLNILKRYEQRTGQKVELNEYTRTGQQTERNDQTSRQCMLCKRCEAALRSANYRLTRIDSNNVSRIRSCAMCHERTYCLEYDVSKFPTKRKQPTINQRREK